MPFLPIPRQSAAWLAVTLGAFAAGRALHLVDEAGLPGADPGNLPATAQSAASGASSKPGAEARHQFSAANASFHSGASSASAPKSGAALEPADIAALGLAYRTATDPLKRRAAFQALLGGLTRENAASIRRELGKLNPDDPDFRDFHFAWGKVAGIAAVMNGVSTDEPDMAPSLAGWAAADPAGAAAWFRNLDLNDPAFAPLIKDRGIPPEQIRAYLARDLVSSLANSDPAAALAIATQRGADGRTIPGLINSIMHQVVLRDGLPDALKWAQNLPESLGSVSYQVSDGKFGTANLRSEAMRTIARTYAKTDPRAAAEWVSTNTTPNTDPGVMRDITTTWAQKSPVDAVTWLERQNNSRSQQESLSAAYSTWAAKDPLPASQHLDAMPPSAARDYAINGFITPIAKEDPQAAVTWAAQIGNASLRESATLRAAQNYFAQDAASAQAWLPTSGLSAQNQATLLAGKH